MEIEIVAHIKRNRPIVLLLYSQSCTTIFLGTSSGASPYNNNQASGGYAAGAGSGYVAGYAATDLAGMYGAAAAAYSSARSVAAAASASALHKVASAAKTKSRSNAGKTDIYIRNSPHPTPASTINQLL